MLSGCFWGMRTKFRVPLTPADLLPITADMAGFLAICFETPANSLRSPTGALVEPINIPDYAAQRDFFLNKNGTYETGRRAWPKYRIRACRRRDF